MRNYTLSCGHTYNRKALVTRAISYEPCDGVCPHCNTPFTDKEGFYLEYSHPKQTMEEFFQIMEEEKERARTRVLAHPPRKLLPECSGICKSGKKCTKVSTIISGVYCNLHS